MTSSCSSLAVPHFPPNLFRSFISAECEAPVEHRREEPHHACQLAI